MVIWASPAAEVDATGTPGLETMSEANVAEVDACARTDCTSARGVTRADTGSVVSPGTPMTR